MNTAHNVSRTPRGTNYIPFERDRLCDTPIEGVSPECVRLMFERVIDADADTTPEVCETKLSLAGFREINRRMPAAWSEGVNLLRDSRILSMRPGKSNPALKVG